MIIRNLNTQAEKKGYTIIKEPVSINLPLIGSIDLPLWFDFEWLYISPKKTRYTMQALAAKFRQKRERRAQRRQKELASIFTRSGIHPQNPYKFYK